MGALLSEVVELTVEVIVAPVLSVVVTGIGVVPLVVPFPPDVPFTLPAPPAAVELPAPVVELPAPAPAVELPASVPTAPAPVSVEVELMLDATTTVAVPVDEVPPLATITVAVPVDEVTPVETRTVAVPADDVAITVAVEDDEGTSRKQGQQSGTTGAM